MRCIERYAAPVLVLIVASLLAGSREGTAAGTAPPQGPLAAALADERHAAALYEAVIIRHGLVAPFVMILDSELIHIDRVLALYESYGIDPPADTEDPDEIAVPLRLSEVCRLAAATERQTIALYERLLEEVTQPDVREVFTLLREVARRRHLPAFERCGARASGRR